ncbi:hypothetical protein GOBAR_DD04000 [Gossypium barbadense]|nr:hypothetical protein GOBAR_DD04000 [Gossypium barbadense]
MQVVRGRIFCSKYSAAPATWVGVRRGRSFAASLPSPSDSPKRKRVSKDERRDLIESFVNRSRVWHDICALANGNCLMTINCQAGLAQSGKLQYSLSLSSHRIAIEDHSVQIEEGINQVNAGKFPSVTAAQKEVGGSYYVVRKVLQELEYKSKICSSNSSFENLSAKAANKGDKSFSIVEVVSTVVQDDTCARAMDDVKMHDTNEKQLEADRECISSRQNMLLVGRGSCHDFVLEENSVLKVDAKGLEKQEDDKVGGLEIDDSDNFLIFPDKQKIVEAIDQDLESDKLFKTESQGVQSEFVVVKDDLPKEETQIGNEEGDKREQAMSKESLDSGSPEPKAEHHPKILEKEKYKHHPEFLEEEKYARWMHAGCYVYQVSAFFWNPSSEQTENAEGSKKSTLWGNLKSFAGGIINIWRKL